MTIFIYNTLNKSVKITKVIKRTVSPWERRERIWNWKGQKTGTSEVNEVFRTHRTKWGDKRFKLKWKKL